jgi:tetratricopeptide (TPR) repeat protein
MEEALDWQPYNPHNWTVYAQALWAAARHSDAIDVLWQARQRFPWNAFMRTELGRLLREAGDLSTSEGVCREAAGHFPANIVCRTSLGETLIDLGNLDGAERVYDEARGLDAHNAYARTGLAQVWFIRSARVRDTTLRDRAKALLEETVQQGNRVAQQLLLTFEERWQRAVDRGGIRPRPAVTRRRIEEMSAAERLGRAMIALWQAERAPSDQERDRLCEEAQRYLDVPESAAGDLLMGFVETRGLVILARGDAQAALDYFRDQIERRGRGGWIGIRLGEQRARGKLGETVELSLDETPFDSRSVRFSVQVANVLSRLAATGAEREVGEMLKMLYPSAARLARQWAEDQEGVDLAARSSAMLASFLDAKWYRPAGIAAEEDLNDPQRVIRAIENVRQTEADTFDVLANTALAAA